MPRRLLADLRRASPGRASAAAARRRSRRSGSPASSTCCMIPPIQTSSPSQSASTSTSIAFSRKRSRKISRGPCAPGALRREVVARGRRASRRSPSPARRARSSGARAAGSRRRRRAASASSTDVRGRVGRRLVAERARAARRSARGPRRGRSRRRSCRAAARRPRRRPGGELQRRLAAELDDHALGPLDLDDAEHVLERQRLEVEAVGGVVVGRDRLRVAVDHHRVAARLADGHRGVHAAVVELDALADAVRARRRGSRPTARSPRSTSCAARALPAGVEVRRRAPRTRRRRCRPP